MATLRQLLNNVRQYSEDATAVWSRESKHPVNSRCEGWDDEPRRVAIPISSLAAG
jgi:hypothetical protein